jgi:hypothetical protein
MLLPGNAIRIAARTNDCHFAMGPRIIKTIKKIGISILVSYLLMVAIALVVRPGFELISTAALPPDFPVVVFWQEADTDHCQVFRWHEYENLSQMNLSISLQVRQEMLSVCQRDIQYLGEHGVWPVTFDWQDARNAWPLATLDSTLRDNNATAFEVSYQSDSNQINQSRYVLTHNEIEHAEYKAYDATSVARAVLPVALALFAVFVIGYGLTKALQKLEAMEQQDK